MHPSISKSVGNVAQRKCEKAAGHCFVNKSVRLVLKVLRAFVPAQGRCCSSRHLPHQVPRYLVPGKIVVQFEVQHCIFKK